ncbi:hypothetical protein DFJ58DRAFT_847111 [Suillus subalutaceus]|uniref:uncharacterized protein n=1 Tax=Suillus subalutaceus TaxID=48586 RepID=UPI001B876F48|nr:uncharacterized protein DFJ58DRAFT_847111 [Suillus subalutaceus]KAG1836168.1 hypothetical protein DFJ58DRAFT_847111 [Suillus subalutaceus]
MLRDQWGTPKLLVPASIKPGCPGKGNTGIHYTLSAQISLPLPPRGVNNVFTHHAYKTCLLKVVLATIVVYDFVTNLGDEWASHRALSAISIVFGLFLWDDITSSGIRATIEHSELTLAVAPGCYSDTSVSGDFILAPYIFLLLLEIEIVGLTLYRMIRHYRATRCRLLTLLAQYSVGYIVTGLLFTIVNIVTNCIVPGDYGPTLEGSQIVAQGLLATRMQLDLWKLNRHSPAVAPTSISTEYSQTDLEFELSQRASIVPSGTVPVI